jgi:hypothetical protein
MTGSAGGVGINLTLRHNDMSSSSGRSWRQVGEKLLEQAVELGIDGLSASQIAQSYARIDDVPAALKTARRIPREFDGSYALQGVADIQTQQSDPKKALK